MKILVTAGNTQTPIDRVRSISNIFTGKTGTLIALEAHRRGHAVTLLTSHPELIPQLIPDFQPEPEQWILHSYRTFDDLSDAMQRLIPEGKFDCIVHCAAVSDYRVAGIFAPAQGVTFNESCSTWNSSTDAISLLDVTSGKVKSSHSELWLRMIPTPKLIDQIRTPWGFRGVLVKFKLEVDQTPSQLCEIARASRRQSDADLIVANSLEGMHRLAYLGNREDEFEEVVRMSLPRRLLERIEQLAHANKPDDI